MFKSLRKFPPLLLTTLAALSTQAQTIPTTTTPTTPPNPTLQESPRPGWWIAKHNAILQRNKKDHVDLIFLGDSITQNYEKHQPPHQDFLPTWEKFYSSRHAVNMGFSGDQTGHLLWRLTHGEIDGIQPKVAVLLIGTNNTASGQTAQQVQAGLDAIITRLHEKLLTTKILLLGILPSDLPTPPNKAAIDAQINTAMAAQYKTSTFVTFLDITPIFMNNGKINASLFYDPTLPPLNGKLRGPLHPDTHGQRMMAQAIEPTLAHLFGDTPTTAP